MDQLEKKIAELVGKLPPLPDRTREFIVKTAPWVTLIMILILLPVILAFLGLGAAFLPFTFLGGAGQGVAGVFTFLISSAILILEIMAIPGLFKRTRKGWLFCYYALLLSGVEDLLTFSLFGLVFNAVLGLYFLFQIRSYYNGGGKPVA